jgi:hypothetical protein
MHRTFVSALVLTLLRKARAKAYSFLQLILYFVKFNKLCTRRMLIQLSLFLRRLRKRVRERERERERELLKIKISRRSFEKNQMLHICIQLHINQL